MKSLLKFWVPCGLLDLYHKKRYPPPVLPNIPLLLSQRTLSELFPEIDKCIVDIPVTQFYRSRDMVLPLIELLTISAICKHLQPRRIFEFGTYKGATTLLMALHTPTDCNIFTLDLDPTEHQQIGFMPFEPGIEFLNVSARAKIHQLYGDSRTFDYRPYLGTVDLVFVDANHEYDFVKSDTEKALTLLRPGGIIIWDDYVWDDRHPECSGVAQYLNEISQTKPCYHISQTRLAISI